MKKETDLPEEKKQATELKANDVRVGNLLRKDGIVVTIDGRSVFDIWSADVSATLNHPYEPIPLSPEWLERGGFKSLENDYKIKDFFIHKRKQGFMVNSRTPVVEHVHQLQNLYFALTGQELNFKG